MCDFTCVSYIHRGFMHFQGRRDRFVRYIFTNILLFFTFLTFYLSISTQGHLVSGPLSLQGSSSKVAGTLVL